MLESLKQILSLSFQGTLLAGLGALIALYIKEVTLARSFEIWKEKKSLSQVFAKYRDPLTLAAEELARRLSEVLDEYPSDFLQASVLSLQVPHSSRNDRQDPHFRQYKCLSSLYRICAFLGWVELYRQEITFLDTGVEHKNDQLGKSIDQVRMDLAEGWLNTADDWNVWRDSLIFREEQRAVGELMIINGMAGRTIMGYGAFVKRLRDKDDHDFEVWINVVKEFMLDNVAEKDFRRIRMYLLVLHSVDLVSQLNDGKVGKTLDGIRVKARKAVADAKAQKILYH